MCYRRLFASCSVLLPTFLLKYSFLGSFTMFPFVSPQMFRQLVFRGDRASWKCAYWMQVRWRMHDPCLDLAEGCLPFPLWIFLLLLWRLWLQNTLGDSCSLASCPYGLKSSFQETNSISLFVKGRRGHPDTLWLFAKEAEFLWEGLQFSPPLVYLWLCWRGKDGEWMKFRVLTNHILCDLFFHQFKLLKRTLIDLFELINVFFPGLPLGRCTNG